MTYDNSSSPLVLPGVRKTGLANLSRRNFMRGVGAGGAAAAAAGLLSACGAGSSSSPSAGGSATPTATDKLVISNWPAYIDRATVNGVKVSPTLEAYQKQTGVAVTYNQDVNDNEEFFAKVRNALAAGEPTGRDMFMLTDWMAAKLIRLKWLETIDKANVPNGTNLIAPLADVAFDPNRDYSLPWQSGLTGISVNKNVYDGEVNTITELLTKPDLKGRVTVLTEMRDTMGLILLDQGANPADFTIDQWSKAMDFLQTAVDSGQIRAFTGNDYLQGLQQGDIAACMAWSGDIIQAQYDDPKIAFVVPDAGAMLWSDNMLIPNGAVNKLNAESWMNYYYDPKVAAELAAWVNYICPVQGAQDAMKKIDPSLVDNPLIFPTEQDYANLSVFRGLTEDEETAFTEQFLAVQGA
ncbi:MAG: spermidine/putrescine ABC transporter substrate-binding protein [Actinomycetes bacterium]